MVGGVTLRTTEHTQYNNLHVKGRHMDKNLYGQYIDAIGNIGAYLPIRVWCAKSGFLRTILLSVILFNTLYVEVKGGLSMIKN